MSSLLLNKSVYDTNNYCQYKTEIDAFKKKIFINYVIHPHTELLSSP